jgi:arginyl-tRNA synthetase
MRSPLGKDRDGADAGAEIVLAGGFGGFLSAAMVPDFDLAAWLDREARLAASRIGIEGEDFAPEIRTADAQHGDYQANGVLPFAKRQRRNPRELANALVEAMKLPAEAVACEVAGPGFINFRLQPRLLWAWLEAFGSDPAMRAGAARARRGETWVVDYSSPNTAKQMHVGHLRSAVIGEAVSRLLEFAGARVIRDNHVGDWGTQFGKLIWAYKRHLDTAALAADPLEEFERLYKVGNSSAESDPAVLDAARQELVRLQSGDAENLAIWRRIGETSLVAFQRIYDRLGLRFDHTLGESFYNDQVDRVYRELIDCGLAVESQGALVVFHPEHPRFRTQPFIVRKSDGAANYASTDLATILYRAQHFGATGALYVVDKRQSDHFEQLFLTAAKWFERTGRALPRLEHVDFGTVLGENGRPLKTRDGGMLKLKDLLDEAVERAFALVTEKSPDLGEEERRAVAEAVGIGAVQYADLSQNRTSDYVFSWDRMLAFDGNTAPYLLYAVARIHSIFRKAGLDPAQVAGEATPPETAPELTLARRLVVFPSVVQQALAGLRPHVLCAHLYELAGAFSSFYNADKVMVDDAAIRTRRLLLCGRTLVQLRTGLELLGLRPLERM